MNTGLLLFKRSSHRPLPLHPLENEGDTIHEDTTTTTTSTGVALVGEDNDSSAGNIDAAWDLETTTHGSSPISISKISKITKSQANNSLPPPFLKMQVCKLSVPGPGVTPHKQQKQQQQQQQKIQQRRLVPARTPSSDTLTNMFEKSWHARQKDDGSSRAEHSDTHTTASISAAEESLNDDSMTFTAAVFPDPNQDFQMQSSSPQKNNSSSRSLNKSFNFPKSPFSSPTTTTTNNHSSLLGNLLVGGKRPGIARQASQGSTDTKTTIEGAAAAGTTSTEMERQRAIYSWEHGSLPSPPLTGIASKNGDATPFISSSSRKIPVSLLHELEREIDNPNSSLHGRSSPARRSYAIASASPRRRGMNTIPRNQSPRSGSRRGGGHWVPEDPVRSAAEDEHRSRRPRSNSPHALAGAASAARRSSTRTRSQSPGVVVDTVVGAPIQRVETPPTSRTRTRRSEASTGLPTIALTPEAIIEQIRKGNFNLELDQSTANQIGGIATAAGKHATNARITLKLHAAAAPSTTQGDYSSEGCHSKSPHSRLSHPSEPGQQQRRGRNQRSSTPPTTSSGGLRSRYDKQESSSSLNKVSRRNSNSSSENAGNRMDPISPSKAARRGRKKKEETKTAEEATAAPCSRSLSHSGHRRRSSEGNYSRSPSGLRDRMKIGNPAATAVAPDEDPSGRKGRRKLDQKQEGLRERNKDPSSSPKKSSSRRSDYGKPSRRSSSREPRSRLRKVESSSSQSFEEQVEFGTSTTTTTTPSFPPNSKAREKFDIASEIYDTRKSSRSVKESAPSSPRRPQDRTYQPATTSMISPPSSNRASAVVISRSDETLALPRSHKPAIVLSPLVLTKESTTSRKTSTRNLFSPNRTQG